MLWHWLMPERCWNPLQSAGEAWPMWHSHRVCRVGQAEKSWFPAGWDVRLPWECCERGTGDRWDKRLLFKLKKKKKTRCESFLALSKATNHSGIYWLCVESWQWMNVLPSILRRRNLFFLTAEVLLLKSDRRSFQSVQLASRLCTMWPCNLDVLCIFEPDAKLPGPSPPTTALQRSTKGKTRKSTGGKRWGGGQWEPWAQC